MKTSASQDTLSRTEKDKLSHGRSLLQIASNLYLGL